VVYCIETQAGQRRTVVDDLMQVQHIRAGDLGMVFHMLQEHKNELTVYEGVRAFQKQKNTSSAVVGSKVEDEAEGSKSKKQKTAEVVAPNFGIEVDVAGVAERDIESVMNGKVELHREGVMNGETELNIGSVVHNEVEGVPCDAQPSYADTVASLH
jgi:hypothetical protein